MGDLSNPCLNTAYGIYHVFVNIINVILKVVICSVVPNMMLFIFFGRTQEFQYLYSKGKGFIQSKILCKKESI